MNYSRIVIVDDEKEILLIQQEALAREGIQCELFSDSLEAWESIRRDGAALVLSDWKMPGLTGLDLLFRTRSLPIPPYFIIITAFGTVNHAVKALNQGAFSFLEKPFDIDHYLSVVKDAISRYRDKNSTASIRPVTRSSASISGPIFRSDAMKTVIDLAAAAAKSESSILLLGESGSGKEVLADFIHKNSRRHSGPCVKVNCGALPEQLMESALFGHERGSFTGADRRNIGRFEQANGGTLFLDEIGDLLPHLQVKLLRALQERTIERLGSAVPIHVDFRLICATHCDLDAAVARKTFREDLFYRINVVPIRVPPLRDRVEDIEPLAQHFFKILREPLESGPEALGASALQLLRLYRWPGNIRQLRNAIEYALVVCRGSTVETAHLPEDIRRNRPGISPTILSPVESLAESSIENGLKASMDGTEAVTIRDALDRCYYNMSAVARDLKISRSSLYERMKIHGIKRPAAKLRN